jgi:uncharacterized protein YfdQ (DUF2303 family)
MPDGEFIESLYQHMSGVEVLQDIPSAEHVAAFSLPENTKVQIEDFERFQPRPRRKRGKAVLKDLASFISYVCRYAEPGTIVYADPDNKRFTAILNGHEPYLLGTDDELATGKPGWGDHIASFEPRWTPGWTAWTSHAGSYLDQQSFADHLVDRLAEIVEPDGAEILEMVRSFHVHSEARYERVLDAGSDRIQFSYVENDVAGSVTVPTKLRLHLAPFDGAEPVDVMARLRWSRPTHQKPTVTFKWDLGEEPRRIIDAAITAMSAQIAEQLPGVPVLGGSFAG